jgi:hypothetical protein
MTVLTDASAIFANAVCSNARLFFHQARRIKKKAAPVRAIGKWTNIGCVGCTSVRAWIMRWMNSMTTPLFEIRPWKARVLFYIVPYD